ncbi:MAG: 3-deoxy-8-phosphooctulonate synthase [Phycisphaerales bacterium JB043]
MSATCRIQDIVVGAEHPLCVIAGPCTLESEELGIRIGTTLRDACATLGLAYVFKASFDKANRTSGGSPRGPGLERGLAQLASVRDALGVPVTTDIHEASQADDVARIVDMLQIPAFLCRQTDLLEAAARAGKARDCAVNIKKGQFLSPREMSGPIGKVRASGCERVMVTERGTFFGYHRLVNDFIGLGELIERANSGDEGGAPVCFDVTHSTQLPGSSATTGGRPEHAPMLAQAAVASGVHAIFLECHPSPSEAWSDAATMLALDDVPELLSRLARLRGALSPDASVAPSA